MLRLVVLIALILLHSFLKGELHDLFYNLGNNLLPELARMWHNYDSVTHYNYYSSTIVVDSDWLTTLAQSELVL